MMVQIINNRVDTALEGAAAGTHSAAALAADTGAVQPTVSVAADR